MCNINTCTVCTICSVLYIMYGSIDWFTRIEKRELGDSRLATASSSLAVEQTPSTAFKSTCTALSSASRVPSSAIASVDEHTESTLEPSSPHASSSEAAATAGFGAFLTNQKIESQNATGFLGATSFRLVLYSKSMFSFQLYTNTRVYTCNAVQLYLYKLIICNYFTKSRLKFI